MPKLVNVKDFLNLSYLGSCDLFTLPTCKIFIKKKCDQLQMYIFIYTLVAQLVRTSER